MDRKTLDAKADVSMTENASHVVADETIDLDQRIQDLVAAAPPFYKNKSLFRLYLLIIPTCLCAAITLGFDASMMSGLQAVPSWDECKSSPGCAIIG